MEIITCLSTMNQTNDKIINKMNIKTNSITVNQCNKNSIIKSKYGHKNLNIWVNSTERGLSKSRNCCLKYLPNDSIFLIADDDMIYVKNVDKIISSAFENNMKADIIAFKVEGVNKKFKKYPKNRKKINYLSSMKISSVQLAIKTNSIKKHNLKFDEDFGSGGKYIMGEESIFLFDALKKGLNVYYEPVKIADLHIGHSTWFNGYNEEYFISRGAVFTRMSRILSLPLIFQFLIRKKNIYVEDSSFYFALKKMLEGRKMYLKDIWIKNS